ncbi:DUF4287 domain-containing protein [Methylobacterium gregans]|uniref:DUF4287 domain-containing protein n=1 Tax=Methylobacterium gregans TaxID=374424 RepID=UPI003521A4BE
MSTEPIKGPASYFPSIEKRYGRPIGEWQQVVRDQLYDSLAGQGSQVQTKHCCGSSR